MKHLILSAALPILALGSCATSNSAEQRASCAAMEKDMGLAQPHDHSAMKGQGLNSMGISHERCQQLLAKPA